VERAHDQRADIGTRRGTTRRRHRLSVAVVVTVGLAGLVVWAIAVSRAPRRVAEPPSFSRFEQAWTSAMAKAGVEATFPPAPVELTEVVAHGRVAFDATFTADEVTALLNVYPYKAVIGGQQVSFLDPVVAFPAAGTGALSGRLQAGESAYSASIAGPVAYTATGIDSPGATELTVEGFSVGGQRRAQATEAIIAYLNLYLRAAPGLTIERAEIVDGGLHAKGSAPARLEHPRVSPDAP
jgi:hypothetical protein